MHNAVILSVIMMSVVDNKNKTMYLCLNHSATMPPCFDAQTNKWFLIWHLMVGLSSIFFLKLFLLISSKI